MKLWLQDKLYENQVAENDFNNLLQSSTEISFTQSCETLNVQENETLKYVSLFPNPVNDKLNLHLSDDSSGGILTIYNAMGQKVLNTKILTNETQLDVSQLQAGFYFYLYSKNGFNHSGKFVKANKN